MALTKTAVVIVLCLLVVISCVDAGKRRSRRTKRNHMTCRPRSLVRYQMTVHTTWDKETFPKMFPTYRPPAHWSQLIGRSHGNNYRMWKDGGNASIAVQKFAEKENAEFFDLELSQGYNGVLDAFVAPTIETSVGQTSTVVSLDGRHSKVSFMMKIVPSPDWFIGLDSAELCYRGRWRKSYFRDLRPFDAGTDQGLTFTSPNWANDPQEPISAITSSSPNHPASSFFYPEYEVLPRLAHVEFEMISEYRLRKVHKKIIQVAKQNVNVGTTSQKATEMEAILKNIEGGNISGKTVSASKENKTSDSYSVATNSHNSNGNNLFSLISKPRKEDVDDGVKTDVTFSMKSRQHNKQNDGMRNLPLAETNTKREPGKPMQSLGKLEARSMSTSERQMTKLQDQYLNDDTDSNEARISTKDRLEAYRERVDCQVSEWSEWSGCSQTCGFGNKMRSREVTILPKHGGAPCPLLREETLCGSMRNCQWKHFSLMRKKVKSPFKTLRRKLVRRRRKH